MGNARVLESLAARFALTTTSQLRLKKKDPRMSNEEFRMERPQPLPSRNSAFYWEGAERGEFLGQRCGDCKTFRHPPRPMCPKCQSVHQEIIPLSGRGVVY